MAARHEQLPHAIGVPAYGAVVDHRLSREQLMRVVQDDLGLALTEGLMQRSFTLLLLANRLHSHIRVYGCKPYIQMFPTIGYKNEDKLLDIRLRLDMMTADECIPAHPIQSQEARRPLNNRMYVLGNTFVEALWLEAPSHLLTESWTSVPTIPTSFCTDDYIDWYLPRTHPRIQNLVNIPSGYNVPIAPAMPPKALLDLIAHECHRQDIDGDEFRRTVRDLLRKYYIAL
ncbi:hypothetical protein M9H77_11226 [Catharanthus roseus]|uniref:Uncharacterized protein n=1 Tax=Catharanthus roseus TaxID=4058 RepID=A0ACC0BE05_CATRO|nr:hypothetical protein M9H77_11226 [Catharanthus roseus]